ncbi:MAG: NAD-dependent epimerase/dehydratase family protein [Proteobacteria bacterium]|nr:NAD-dependent epimerase/dehydratase family protein [Pseudomonadota bacterium]
MTRSTVLILGAGGRFGGAAMQAFAAAGWTVLAQQRQPPPALPANARLLQLGLADAPALARAAAGATLVVHAINPPYTRWERELLPLFRQGLAVAERLGARFMLPGNVYAYGQTMPPLLREDTPPRPSTRKGELRAAMEDELARRAAQGLDAVVIRAGDFFGSGRGSWLDLVIAKDLARGQLVYPGPLDVLHAWAYLPDLAQAFVAVAGDGGHRGLLRLHFAGVAVTGHEFSAALQAAAGELGLRPAQGFRVGGLPWPAMRALGLVRPMLREIVRMRYLWRVPHALDGTALRRHVGALPATPLPQALQQALRGLGFGPGPGRQAPLSLAGG